MLQLTSKQSQHFAQAVRIRNQLIGKRLDRFQSCPLATAAGESPSEPAAFRLDSDGWPPQLKNGAAGSESYSL